MKFKGENLLGKKAVAVLLMSFCALVGDESLNNGQNLSKNLLISAENQSTHKFIANLNENSATLASSENNATPEISSDESDFGFDEFEAEFESFKVNDPLSGYNKMMTRFNVALYTYALRPIAKGYEFVMPEFARVGIKNFASYINMPIRFLGNVLQLKFKEAGTELKRFGVNTIFGFFGLIDAASRRKSHCTTLILVRCWRIGAWAGVFISCCPF